MLDLTICETYNIDYNKVVGASEFRSFVGEFVDFRHDIVSSDREAAAFMFALESMGALI